MIVTLNIRQYARLVEEMRAAQRAYANTRTRKLDSSDRSPKLEKAVDEVTAEILKGPKLLPESMRWTRR